MTDNENKSKLASIAIHAGEHHKIQNSVTTPIFQSATYLESDSDHYNDIKYLRLNNSPNHEILENKCAQLCGSDKAIVCASGMNAITTALLAVLQSGDHILAQEQLYGGTNYFFKHILKKLNITVHFVDPNKPESWQDYLKQPIKLFYCESISNPLLDIPQLKKIISFCKNNTIISAIDNTFASPYNYLAKKKGFDLVFHSATKYLNGHSDLVAGLIACNAEHETIIRTHLNILGGTLDPHTCFLLQRGLKTFAARMQQHNQNAQDLFKYLSKHPKVDQIYFPKQNIINREHMQGTSGMISFEVKNSTAEGLKKSFKLLKTITHAPSLGGVESLITLPSQSSHAALSPIEREQLGIKDSLVRLSVGIENISDIIYDLDIILS